MLTVHHLRSSQSERIVWLCEELEVNYELKLYNRRADNRMAPDEYKALHPMGIAPVIEDGDLVLGESGAICGYLNRKYGGGRMSPSPDDSDFTDYLFFVHWSNATFMASLMMQLAVTLTGGMDKPGAAFVNERVERSWALAERRVGDSEFFGGRKLTTADIMMVYILTTARAFANTPLDGFPNIRAYLQRIGARPAYQRAMAKAEPGWTPKLD